MLGSGWCSVGLREICVERFYRLNHFISTYSGSHLRRIGINYRLRHPDSGMLRAFRGMALLRRLGFKTAAMALRDDSLSIDDPRLLAEEKLAIVLGTEGDGLADGTIPDPRGICTMWGPDKKAHAAARLPMLYIATWYATGDKHWADMYEKYIDDAIRMTIVLKDLTEEQVKYYMPCYALYQAMCSLEIIYDYEKDPSRRALLEECMAEFSRRAHLRATLADPANPPYGMCWDGELALAAMMDPMYEMDDFDRTFLKEAVERTAPLRMGWCRAAHIYAAWWRYLAREKERTEKQ